MKIKGLKVSDKVLLEQKEKELEEMLKGYLGLKHDLLKDNNFKFNINIAAYENKKLILRFDLSTLEELSTSQLVQAIRKRKYLLGGNNHASR